MTPEHFKSFAAVVFCMVAIAGPPVQLCGQQTDPSPEKQDAPVVEEKEVRGTLSLNGHEQAFSSLGELEAIIERLRGNHQDDDKVIPNYIEMKATSQAASQKFYERAFGLKFTSYGPQYSAVTGSPFSIGLASGDRPEVPLPAFQTFDIEATLKAVRAANGKIEKDIFAFPGGKRFECLDPAGNRIAIFQND